METKVPVLGNNIDIGYGAVIWGDITIADNVKIGAKTEATKSRVIEGAVLVDGSKNGE